MAFSRERDAAAEVMSAELRLLDPAVRASAAEVSTLLHDEFFKYSVSGAVWDRTQITAALSADPTIDGKPSDVGLARLGPDAMLLTYRLEGQGSRVPPELRLGTGGRPVAVAVPPGHAV